MTSAEKPVPRPATQPPAKKLSKIGLGCTTFGREIDRAASFAMMDYALANGITHFDTAAGYANGESERIIGAWLVERKVDPARLAIATKAFPPYSPEQLEQSVAASLQRLGVPEVEIFFFHKWDETAADPKVLATLDGLVRAGKIRRLGASNFSAEQFKRVLDLQSRAGFARLRALQNNNNFSVRHFDAAYRKLCEANEVSVVTYSPLGAGFLTGKHRKQVAEGSRFDIAPAHQAIYFNELAWKRLDQLEEIARRFGQSQVILALAWALRQPGVECVLVGGRNPSQLQQAREALALEHPELWKALDAVP